MFMKQPHFYGDVTATFTEADDSNFLPARTSEVLHCGVTFSVPRLPSFQDSLRF